MRRITFLHCDLRTKRQECDFPSLYISSARANCHFKNVHSRLKIASVVGCKNSCNIYQRIFECIGFIQIYTVNFSLKRAIIDRVFSYAIYTHRS